MPLPEWLVDPQSPPQTPTPPPPPVQQAPPSSYHNTGHIVNVYNSQPTNQKSSKNGGKTTSRQIQNAVTKQIGNIGKKLKKNFGSMIGNQSNNYYKSGSQTKNQVSKSTNRQKTEVDLPISPCPAANEQKRIVSGAQSFILGAVILTDDNLLPYQDEMISNYLQVLDKYML